MKYLKVFLRKGSEQHSLIVKFPYYDTIEDVLVIFGNLEPKRYSESVWKFAGGILVMSNTLREIMVIFPTNKKKINN